MANLPRTRQKRLKSQQGNRRAARRALARAFLSFTEVAGSLEKSYDKLQTEVGSLREELQKANCELANSLEENDRIRLRLSRTLEGLPCGVLALDSRGAVRVINPEARRLLLTSEDWLPESTSPVPEGLQKFISSALAEDFSATQEMSLARPGGPAFIAITRTRLKQDGEDGDENILILRDVSEEKRVAAEREATRRIHALAELSTLLAHEIRNPLGSLELFAGLVADATENLPDARHWVDHLQAGLRGLSATVNNVLNFHSQPSPTLAPISLHRLLRESTEFLRPLARQRGMQLSLITRIAEVRVAADPHRLQQVLFNISLNAFRAMSSGGALFIRVDWAPQEDNRKVQIDFEDRGSGIATENLQKIFDPGFSTIPGSPGLGLSVCKTVVEQHHGTIAVRSVLNRGTTFTLCFPVVGGQE